MKNSLHKPSSVSSPKVSIVIPVYNGANFLSEAINSALAQTYKNLEIIIVNDGSTDDGETERIALSYNKKINYYTKKNGGVASALNFGIERMTGEYFSWLSHDDLYENTKIEEEVRLLTRQEDAGKTIIACDAVALFDSGIKKKDSINQRIFNTFFDIFLATSAGTGLNGCSLLIPRKALISVGMFKLDLPVTQDYDLWFRLKENCNFVLLSRPLVIYRHHDMQDSIQKARLCLIAGDDLRAKMLKTIHNGRFAEFMDSSKDNQKWLLKNYRIYKKRGYKKTSLMIYKYLLIYYNSIDQSYYTALTKEDSMGSTLGTTSASLDEMLTRIDERLNVITEEDYSFASNSNTWRGSVRSYIQSVRDDGIVFMVRKAIRKLMRIIPGH